MHLSISVTLYGVNLTFALIFMMYELTDNELTKLPKFLLDYIDWIHNKQGRRTTGRRFEGSKPTPTVLCH